MQRLVERELVGMVEAAAGGEALGEAGDGDAGGAQKIGDVAGGGFAFDIGAEGEDDFLGFEGFDAFDEGFEAQILGGDVVERRQLAAKDMVEAVEGSAAFEAEHVGGLFDDAKEARVALRIMAEQAGAALLDEKAAVLTSGDLAGEAGERLGERRHAVATGLHHPEHETLGTARTETGQRLELRDEALERRWVVDGHGMGAGFKFQVSGFKMPASWNVKLGT